MHAIDDLIPIESGRTDILTFPLSEGEVSLRTCYSSFVRSFERIGQDADEAKARFNELVRTTSDQQSLHELVDFDVHLKVAHELPSFHCSSYMVLAHSLFEHTLTEQCRTIKNWFQQRLDYKDLRHIGIERSKVYLSKVANITAPFEDAAFGRITFYAEIRNIIAHSSALISGENTKLLARVRQEPLLPIQISSVDMFGHTSHGIRVQPHFVTNCVNDYLRFLYLLKKHLPEPPHAPLPRP